MKSISCLAAVAAFTLSGCANTLVHTPADLAKPPQGVRWTETRPYDVYVYVGGEQPKLVYFGTHDLLPKVNQTAIDDARPTWEVNYHAQMFSDGGLELVLDDNGALKRVKATGKPGAAGALNAATTVAKTKDDIQAEELADVKRQADLLKAKTDLIKNRSDLEKAMNPAGTTNP